MDLHAERVNFMRVRRVEEAIRIAGGEVAGVEYYAAFCDDPARVRDEAALAEFSARTGSNR